MSGNSVGTAYLTLVPKLQSGWSSGITSELSGIDGTAHGTKSGSGFGRSFAVAAGNLLSSGIQSALGAISSSIGDAVSRVDTLNNFPKVMSTLGYSADDASTSVSKMSDHLTGLPTTLDDMTTYTQRLTAAFGDLDTGTDTALALNDMMLAGGASTEVASSAMEQFTQMLSSGTVDMQAWRSVMTAAPGQMNQLAESMLGAGSSADDLYSALQDGTVSMDDLCAAVVTLDTEGAEGVTSFAEQAKDATGGIATSWTNVQTAVTRSIANIIQQVESTGAITDSLQALSTGIGDIGNYITQGLSGAISGDEMRSGIADSVQGIIETFATTITDGLPEFLDTGLTVIEGLVEGIGQALPELIPQLVECVTSMTGTLIEHVPDIVQAAITLALGLVEGFIEALPQLIAYIPELIQQVALALIEAAPQIAEAAGEVIGMLVTAFFTEGPQIVAALGEILAELPGTVLGVAGSLASSAISVFLGMVNGAVSVLSTVPSTVWGYISQIPARVQQAFGNMVSAGKYIIQGLISGINAAKDAVFTTVTNLISGFTSRIKSFFGIASPSKLMASYGRYIGQGLANGIDSTATGVARAAAGLSSAVMDGVGGIEASYSLAGNVGSFGTSSPQVTNIYIDGARVNASEDVEDLFYSFMTELRRIGAMAGGAA